MIVIDVETTGIDPVVSCIISIGAVDFENPANEFYEECSIPDTAEVQAEALNINGFRIEDIRNPHWRMPVFDVLRKFRDWTFTCTERTPGGLNPMFDLSFIDKWCRRAGLKADLGHRTVDLHSEVYSWFRRNRHTMSAPLSDVRVSAITTDFIHPWLGLPEEPKPHHALTGARFETEAFYRLWFGYPCYAELGTYPLPAQLMR